MLKRSNDRKVANSVTKGGNPNIRNAFGLPAGISCPGMTDFCGRICYAKKMERIPTMKGVRDTVAHNWELLSNASLIQMVDLLDQMMIDFEKDCDRKNADRLFRIHWDGDFFSTEYARAWAIVIRSHPNVQFWAYTRSFTGAVNVVPFLVGIPNLTLYLSADEFNVNEAEQVALQYVLPIAYVGDTFDSAPELDGKTYRCPENAGSLPLITDKGSACKRCGVCVVGRGNVLFSVSKT